MLRSLIAGRVRTLMFAVVVAVLIFVLPIAAQESTVLDLPGLDQPVEILVDQWGISHIYAETEHDLFYAQGWNAARDRPFQLELWRRQATEAAKRKHALGCGSSNRRM